MVLQSLGCLNKSFVDNHVAMLCIIGYIMAKTITEVEANILCTKSAMGPKSLNHCNEKGMHMLQ